MKKENYNSENKIEKYIGNKLSPDYVSQYIKDRNGVLLSEYKASKYKLKIQCLKDGHIWYAIWNNIEKGHWCPKCAHRVLPTKEELACFIENKNGTLISSYGFKNARSKITVQCKKDNYTWKTTWDYLKQGNWCPKCSKKTLLTYDELKEFIKNKNGMIVEKRKHFNCLTKFKIKCLKDNHEWSVTYGALIVQKQWCPKCAKKILKSFEEVKLFVENKNGILRSNKEDLKNNKSKLKIQCEKGHQWNISYANLINNNRWCPTCGMKKVQRELLSIISDIFKTDCVFNFKGFDWLKDKGKLEIDIWVPKIKLAIEYDGPHHFKTIAYGGDKQKAKRRLMERKRKDTLKNKLIKLHKEEINYFIRFNYLETITKEYVIEKLKQNGIILERSNE